MAKGAYATVDASHDAADDLDGPETSKPSGSLFWMGWLVEISCTILGAVLLVTLYVVLRHYDGRPTPSFGSAFGTALTLNTIVAILATVAKAALLFPVA